MKAFENIFRWCDVPVSTGLIFFVMLYRSKSWTSKKQNRKMLFNVSVGENFWEDGETNM